MEDDNVLVYLARMPQRLIAPMDLNKFQTLGNTLASDQGKKTVPFSKYNLTAFSLKDIHYLATLGP